MGDRSQPLANIPSADGVAPRLGFLQILLIYSLFNSALRL
ncbi:hypothetical protein MIZ03_3508 [Rhodoferax lithotrophicus]|uniref:MFS transporter n=1 Tax=Rhodoferax lithotrophicus TaxID=2798804 RepID=A0ABM7MQH9_9BURK|nr:hypothetical protein MIZ03_3508 [Rhodoferax sp. MIZ03]